MIGVVLVGGRSRRMGSEKGLMKFEERTLAQHVVQQMKEHVDIVYISCRKEQVHAYEQFAPCLTDDGDGPLKVFEKLYEFAPNECFLVAACDMPNVRNEEFELLARFEGLCDGAFFHNSDLGDIQPFPGFYSQSLVSQMKTESNQIIREIVKSFNIIRVIPRNSNLLTNWNLPEDMV